MSTPDHSAEDFAGRQAPPRRTRNRRARGPRLTGRDEEILRWICRHGVVNAELVGRRFFWRPDTKTYGKWAAYRRLRALADLGLVLNNKPLADLPAAIRVTREGARIADVGLRPAPLVVSQLRHSFAVVVLGEYLLAANPGSTLTTERELRAERYREMRNGNRRTGIGRCPDALLTLPDAGSKPGQTVAIELDLTRKDRRTIDAIIRAYDHEPVDAVWWFVAPGRVEGIKKIVRSLKADDRIELRPWRG
ncbi:MAG: hypothetical protein QOF36_509 [Microbacteriaceae bacterium]|jgi:hypothetical protein|nr:hypothetical protein [Microbacteriaceae bacterium]